MNRLFVYASRIIDEQAEDIISYTTVQASSLAPEVLIYKKIFVSNKLLTILKLYIYKQSKWNIIC